MRSTGHEGTIELKFADTKEPNLKSLCRGNQKAALLEYYEGGGKRRFALCYCNGYVYIWHTEDFRKSLLGDGKSWTTRVPWETVHLDLWLTRHLEVR